MNNIRLPLIPFKSSSVRGQVINNQIRVTVDYEEDLARLVYVSGLNRQQIIDRAELSEYSVKELAGYFLYYGEFPKE